MRPQDVITAGDDIELRESRRDVARDVNSSCETCAARCLGSSAGEMDPEAVGKQVAWRVETRRTMKARRNKSNDRIDRGRGLER